MVSSIASENRYLCSCFRLEYLPKWNLSDWKHAKFIRVEEVRQEQWLATTQQTHIYTWEITLRMHPIDGWNSLRSILAGFINVCDTKQLLADIWNICELCVCHWSPASQLANWNNFNSLRSTIVDAVGIVLFLNDKNFNKVSPAKIVCNAVSKELSCYMYQMPNQIIVLNVQNSRS